MKYNINFIIRGEHRRLIKTEVVLKLEKEMDRLRLAISLIKTEVVLKLLSIRTKFYLEMFNKNRSCIEINTAEHCLKSILGLIKTEVVLKYDLVIFF